LRVQNAAQEIRQNRGILNRVRLRAETMASILGNFFDVSFYAFTRNYSLFTWLFKSLLISEKVAGTISSSFYKFYKKIMKLKKRKR
jgi:hypothetical protein